MPLPIEDRPVARQVQPFGVERRGAALPHLVARRDDDDAAVSRRKHLIRHAEMIRRAECLANDALRPVLAVEVVHEVRRTAQQRALDNLAFAGTLAMEQGREDRADQRQTRVQIDDRGAASNRRTIGLAGKAHQSAMSLQGKVVGSDVRQRPLFAVRIELAIDQARIGGAQLIVAEAKARHRTRTEVVDDDVAALGHGHRGRAPCSAGEIDRYAALVAIQGNERRADPPRLGEGFLGHAEIACLIAATGFLHLDTSAPRSPRRCRGRAREHARNPAP